MIVCAEILFENGNWKLIIGNLSTGKSFYHIFRVKMLRRATFGKLLTSIEHIRQHATSDNLRESGSGGGGVQFADRI